MCGSSSPVKASSRPSSFRRARVLVRFSQPAASKASRISSHGLWTAPTTGLLPFSPSPALGLLQQVERGVAQPRPVVVVRPEDVHAREGHQGPQGVEHLGDALGVGEVVAGVHDEVGAQAGEGLQPGALLALPADHVDVRDLEYAQRAHPLGKDRHRDPAQAEGPRLESGGVGHTRGPHRRDSGSRLQGYSVTRTHGHIVADAQNRWAPPPPHLAHSPP